MTSTELKLQTKFLEIIHAHLNELRAFLKETVVEINNSSDSGELLRLEARKVEIEILIELNQKKFKKIDTEKSVHVVK